MTFLQILSYLLKILQAFIGLFYIHRLLLVAVGFFTTRKFPAAKSQHKYAFLIAARNEEAVIGQLIDSIRSQDYPSDLLAVFVVADNCTDRTAEVARKWGAVCYERQDTLHRTKGYALEYLVDCIGRDYGIESYEGYFLFDADNLLSRDYVARMNDAFDAGEKIITSYRNTKNFRDNWISASYGIHWMRTIRTEHRARSALRLSTRIQGTGFLMDSRLLQNGWHYTSLTEDRSLSADAVVSGYRISYQDAAEFYDEQPISLRIALRQRIRWSKGHLQAFRESGIKLFCGIFRHFGRLRGLACYDMFSVILPRAVFTVFNRWLGFLLALLIVILQSRHSANARELLSEVLLTILLSMGSAVLVAAYTLIMERKHLPHMRWYQKLWFCLTFSLFDVIGRISMVIALFCKVEWKPIPHNRSIHQTDIH